MDKLWLREGLDLKIVTFACVATGENQGILEMVTEAKTLREIQVYSRANRFFVYILIEETGFLFTGPGLRGRGRRQFQGHPPQGVAGQTQSITTRLPEGGGQLHK